jgi:hypothetical protein
MEMHLLQRSTKRFVIDVADIKRGVHLIPKFGDTFGEIAKIKGEIDELMTRWKVQIESSNSEMSLHEK